MASRLYKVLNSVESYRKNLIKSLREKNFNIEDDASFGTINAKIDGMLPVTEYNDNITYYDNPEDDPMVLKYPSDWPDIETILKSKRSHFRTVDEVEYELYPYEIVLFTASAPTIKFMLKAWLSYPAKNNDDVFIVGSPYTTNKQNYACYLSLETSDGTFIDFDPSTTNTQSVEHTFDETKDIVAPDGTHFKYIVLYQSIRKLSTTTAMSNTIRTNALFYTLPRHGANITSYAMVANLIFTKAGSTYSSTSGTSGQQDNLQYIKYLTEGFYYVPTERDGSETYNMLYYQGVPNLASNGYTGPYYRLELHLLKNNVMYYYDTTFLMSGSYIKTNTLISNSKTPCYTSGAKTNNLIFPNKLVYCNCLAVVPGNFSGSGNDAVRYIKYIVGYDLEYSDEDYENNYSVYRHNLYNGYWPFLRNFEPLTHTMRQSYRNALFQQSGNPESNLNLSRLTTIYTGTFYGMRHCNVVDLSGYTGTLLSPIGGIKCNKLILTGMETITNGLSITYSGSSGTPAYGIPAVIEFDLSNVTDITISTDYLISGVTYDTMPTKVVNVSSLRNLSKASAFNCFHNLETLILSDQFKFNITLNNLRRLRTDCLKDIFNKAAQLEDGETCTLKLAAYLESTVKSMPEYQTILNKGWTVTFD